MHTNAHGHVNARQRLINHVAELRQIVDLHERGYVRGDDERESAALKAGVTSIEAAIAAWQALIDLPVHYHIETEHNGNRQRFSTNREPASDDLLRNFAARNVQCTCENGERILQARAEGRSITLSESGRPVQHPGVSHALSHSDHDHG